MLEHEKMPTKSSSVCIHEMLNMEEPNDDGISEVATFFNGCNIFVTGGTGFLGTLLIEKLLRECKGIQKLYMLIRPKKHKNSEERLKKHFEDLVYDRVRKEDPNFMNRVVMIEGDTGAKDLGLSPEDRQLLIDNVHIVFHSAATTRFTEKLRTAITINVIGIKSMLMLAKEIKNLQAFIHISTAFSNCNLDRIEEKLYKPPAEVENIISLIETLDDDVLADITPKLLKKWPNTYTYSKALGEEVVRFYGKELPVCIVRPAIMLHTAEEPFKLWNNNIIGIAGASVGVYVGLIHVLYINKNKIAEIIPADYVINNIIVAAWDIGMKKTNKELKKIHNIVPLEVEIEEPPVYNCVSSCQNPLTWGTFIQNCCTYIHKTPTTRTVWRAAVLMTPHKWLFTLLTYLWHFLPAQIIDILLKLAGRKPMFMKIYKKIYELTMALSFIDLNSWEFSNKRSVDLYERLSSTDKKKFFFIVDNLDWVEYIRHGVRGTRVYILKDPMANLEKARVKYKMLTIVHYTIIVILSLLNVYAVISYLR